MIKAIGKTPCLNLAYNSGKNRCSFKSNNAYWNRILNFEQNSKQ